MAVYKEEKTNTWRVIYRYTDWTGERKQSQKRGFKTKREALTWEREQLNKATADLDMTFASFVEQYTADMKTRIKENTWATKDHIIGLALTAVFTGPAGVRVVSAVTRSPTRISSTPSPTSTTTPAPSWPMITG